MDKQKAAPALPSLQEIFDKTALHLLRQNRRSLQPGSALDCAYRGENGIMCAVGVWIKDEHYDADLLEAKTADDKDVVKALVKSGVLPEPTGRDLDFFEDEEVDPTEFGARLQLLSTLQSTHDYQDPSQWRNSLIECAKLYELSPVAVENFGQ